MMQRLTDLAYLAGLIDGEGSICIHRQQRKGQRSIRYYPTVHIYNSNKSVLAWVVRTFGGSVHLNHKAGVRSGILFRKDVWMYAIAADKLRPLLQRLLPFLKIKKPNAIKALKLPTYDSQTWRTRRQRYGPSGGN